MCVCTDLVVLQINWQTVSPPARAETSQCDLAKVQPIGGKWSAVWPAPVHLILTRLSVLMDRGFFPPTGAAGKHRHRQNLWMCEQMAPLYLVCFISSYLLQDMSTHAQWLTLTHFHTHAGDWGRLYDCTVLVRVFNWKNPTTFLQSHFSLIHERALPYYRQRLPCNCHWTAQGFFWWPFATFNKIS